MRTLSVIVGIVLLGTSLALSSYLFLNKQGKTGYIYIEKVYEAYKGKAAIERDLKIIENKQKNILDTLRLELIDLDNKYKSGSSAQRGVLSSQIEVKQKDYERLLEEFSNYNEGESKKHVNELLKQINQYVEDYGKNENYEFIFGAIGNGSLMYAKKENDVTEEVIKYVNKRYEGD